MNTELKPDVTDRKYCLSIMSCSGKTVEMGTGCRDIMLEGEPGPDGKQHCLVLEESDTTLYMTGTLWRVSCKRET